jgi:hypothetical protein
MPPSFFNPHYSVCAQIATKLVGLLSVRDVDAEPRSDEARRRLCFFANSLFMELPPAPAVPSMHSFSVMTPFYSEGGTNRALFCYGGSENFSTVVFLPRSFFFSSLLHLLIHFSFFVFLFSSSSSK